MSSMTQIDRNQFSRYDLRDTTRLTRVSDRGRRIISVLSIVFLGVLAALTYAAIQVFDGMHHVIVLADVGLILVAIAVWLASTRQPEEIEADTQFIPKGLRPVRK